MAKLKGGKKGIGAKKKANGGKKACLCEFCAKTFSSKISLREHTQTCNAAREATGNNTTFPCIYCGKIFLAKPNLRKHQRTCDEARRVKKELNGEEDLYPCELCDRPFKTKDWRRMHLKNCKGPKRGGRELWPCDYCDKVFDSKTKKSKHMERGCANARVANKIEGYACRYCFKKLSTALSLSRHTQTCNAAREATGNNTTFLCSFCDKVFLSKYNLQQHNRICKDPNAPTTAATGTEDRYPCDFCPKLFDSNSKKRVHIRKGCAIARAARESSGNVKRYPCKYCGKKLKSSSARSQHNKICKAARKATGNTKTYPCLFCEKVFLTKQILQQHTKTCEAARAAKKTDTGEEELFPCDFCCDKIFTSKFYYNNHMNICEAAIKAGKRKRRRYPCKFCKKVFKSSNNRSSHKNFCNAAIKKIKKETEGWKPYKCHHCPKTFDSKGRRQAHMRIVREEVRKAREEAGGKLEIFECLVCKVLFSSKKYLKRHVTKGCNVVEEQVGNNIVRRIVFKCSACHNLFGTRRLLNQHFFATCVAARKLWKAEENDRAEGDETNYCGKCKTTYSSKHYYKLHGGAKLHCNSVRQSPHHINYPCYTCTKVMDNVKDLNSHLEQAHNIEHDEEKLASFTLPPTEEDFSCGVYVCSSCGQVDDDLEMSRLHTEQCLDTVTIDPSTQTEFEWKDDAFEGSPTGNTIIMRTRMKPRQKRREMMKKYPVVIKFPCFKCSDIMGGLQEIKEHLAQVHNLGDDLKMSDFSAPTPEQSFSPELYICCGCGEVNEDVEVAQLHMVNCLDPTSDQENDECADLEYPDYKYLEEDGCCYAVL